MSIRAQNLDELFIESEELVAEKTSSDNDAEDDTESLEDVEISSTDDEKSAISTHCGTKSLID
ncbi:MAG: hypothetical protein M1839_005672 [Geoglossum umbratile]|nr:MAG: hypothetical protein M1839_005672 [Geoglossum umbratile]